MAADHTIVWSDEARHDLQNIYDRILSRWSVTEAEQFLDLVEEFENVIRVYPKCFKSLKEVENVRLGLIHPNTTAVYRLKELRIEILTLFDNRENDDFRV